MHILTALAIAALALMPTGALAQSKGVAAKVTGTVLDISVDWSTFNDALRDARRAPLLDNRCGTQARISDAAAMQDGDGQSAQVSISVDVTRYQCTRTKELSCRGLICKPAVKERRTKLFASPVYVKLDMRPDTVSGDGKMRFRPTPESTRAMKRLLSRNVPDYGLIERRLIDRMEAVFETSIGADALRTLDLNTAATRSLGSSITSTTRPAQAAPVPSNTSRTLNRYTISPKADRSGLKLQIIQK